MFVMKNSNATGFSTLKKFLEISEISTYMEKCGNSQWDFSSKEFSTSPRGKNSWNFEKEMVIMTQTVHKIINAQKVIIPNLT